ncbi:MAG: hypothetical protein AABW51_02570 [Nanoarchaeota archaeon]
MKKRGLKFNKTLILVLSLIIVLELVLLGFNYNSTGNIVKKFADDIIGAKTSNFQTPSPSTQATAKATVPTTPTTTTRVNPQTQNSLGELVTKEGVVELMIIDNFKEPQLSKEVYYLNDNGKRYELSTDKHLPVKSKIKVTGYLKDNKISFSDTNSNLRGTSYSVASANVEPWPKTLGEQKYVVVYLLNEADKNNFDAENFTNITFGLVNNWIKDASYGKANIHVDFGGSYIYDNFSNCDYSDYVNIAINKSDQDTNFSKYDGIIVYSSTNDCFKWYSGMAAIGKNFYLTNEGIVNIYSLWINHYWQHYYDNEYPNSFNTLVHEFGHNFGLMHAKEILVIEKYHTYYEYGDFFDVMGFSSFYGDYGVFSKKILGWNDNNIAEVEEGIFFITPLEKKLINPSEIHGIKIPINYNISIMNLTPVHSGDYNLNLLSNYYVEYRGYNNYSNKNLLDRPPTEERFKHGLLIRLGQNEINNFENIGTFLINTHSSFSEHFQSPWPLIFKNETYFDSFNNMSISVLDMNDSGALIEVTKQPTCTDSDGGYNYNMKGIVTYQGVSYTDYCV